MNGKRARQVRRALQYEKAPDHLVERGGLFEADDGRLMFRRAANHEANRYRWWKRGVTGGQISLGIVAHLARPQELRLQTIQDDLRNGEENE